MNTALVAVDLGQDPIVYPDPAAWQRLHDAALSAEYTRLQNREFDRFGTGR